MRKDPIKITKAKGQMNKKCFVEIKLQFFQQYISLSFQQPGFTWISYVRQPFCWVLADLKHDTVVDNTAQKLINGRKIWLFHIRVIICLKLVFWSIQQLLLVSEEGEEEKKIQKKKNLVLKSSKTYCVISLSSFKIFF